MMLAMVYQRVVVCVVPTVFSFCQPSIRLVNVILPKFGSLLVGMSVRPSSVGYVKNDDMMWYDIVNKESRGTQLYT